MTQDTPAVPVYVARLQTPSRAECRAFSQIGKSIGWVEHRLGADEFGVDLEFEWERCDSEDESPRWRLKGNLYGVIDEVVLEDPISLKARYPGAFEREG